MMDSRLFDVHHAAAYMDVTFHAVKNWQRRGYLPYVKMGCTVRFKVSDLDTFIAERRRRSGRLRAFITSVDQELPVELTARLIGVSVVQVRSYLQSRRLKDRSPDSIRRFIELAYHVQLKKNSKL